MDMDGLKYLLEALRTSPAPASTVASTGPRAGQELQTSSDMHPIEQRRDGYRLYVQEKKQNQEDPMSYQEWISQEQ